MRRVAFVGQTPPPYGGQAIMIEKIYQGKYENVKLFHVRMNFSKEMNEIGKFSFFKIIHLFSVVLQIVYLRVCKRATILYYPPAGPDKIPVIRDIAILLSTRWLFKRTIFHFHAGGVSQVKFKYRFLNTLFEYAYHNPDVAILLSDLNPPDGRELHAKYETVIPYGIEDNLGEVPTRNPRINGVKILFVGIIKESKGILILLKSCRILKDKDMKFKLEIMGKFESSEFEAIVNAFITNYKLIDYVKFVGVLYGDSKLQVFKNADIFCFPTFFESETFGVVILEAFQASLPVVSTVWRGIPSIITDGDVGFLVEPKNEEQLAQKLQVLIQHPDLRKKMGDSARKRYESEYTLDKFHNRMENIFQSTWIA